MCYTCGCTPCKCGAKIVGGLCEGCGKEYNQCDCESHKAAHDVCHNPCTVCRNKGYLENGEICPVCAGTGCKDKRHCVPAGGLGCEP